MKTCHIALTLILLSFLSSVSTAQASKDKPLIELLTSKILVLDPDGNPVEGAKVYCSGMRTRIAPGSHWGWDDKIHGPMPKLLTNAEGIVEMPYPKYVEEKLETGTMTWTVEHPSFVPFRDDRSVADDPAKIELARGFRIAATAVNAKTNEKIKTDLFAVIGGSSADWELKENGMLVSPTFAKSDTTLRICQFAEGQPALFSDAIKIEPGDRSRILLKDVKLSIGTRVEGKLADAIERPVKNGYISAAIVKSTDTANHRTRWKWRGKTPINEDGTFVFKSVPRDEVIQLIPICDGWVPVTPAREMVATFFPGRAINLNTHMSSPLPFQVVGEAIKPTIPMEKSTSIRITVQQPDGKPLSGAEVLMWPNQYWFNSGSQVLGSAYSTREILVQTRAGGYEWDQKRRFQAFTDKNGTCVIHNLPVSQSESIFVDHDDFDMPISDRDSRVASVDLKADEIVEFTIKMQAKGADSLGVESVEEDSDTKAEEDKNETQPTRN